MRRNRSRFLTVTLPLLSVMLSAAFVVAATGPPQKKPDTAARSKPKKIAGDLRGPGLSFETTEHDFGEIWQSDKPTCRFEFTNNGDARLVIRQVKTSCGCTAAALDKKEFEPGEGSAIAVTFSPKGPGRQSKTITVTSNETGGAPRTLKIRADVKSLVTVAPRMLRLGHVHIGEEHTAILELTPSDETVAIERVRALGSFMTANLLPVDDDSKRGTRQVEVTITPDAPWGEMSGTVEIECSGRPPGRDRMRQTIRTAVQAQVYGEVSADQTMFRFRAVGPGAAFQKRVRLTRSEGEPFEVLDTSLEQRGPVELRVRAERVEGAGGAAWDIILGGRAPANGKENMSIYGLVTVTTDVPGEEKLRIRGSGVLRSPAR